LCFLLSCQHYNSKEKRNGEREDEKRKENALQAEPKRVTRRLYAGYYGVALDAVLVKDAILSALDCLFRLGLYHIFYCLVRLALPL